jgi:hypothetical protein
MARLLIVLVAALLMTGCQPDAALPNSITSQDTIGEISVSYPDPWRDAKGAGIVNGRLAVTLVRADDTPEADLSQYPIIRISYENRAQTSLAQNASISEYATQVAREVAPDAVFEPPAVIQAARRPAAEMRGTDSAGRGYAALVIDFADQNGAVTLLLSQPGGTGEREQATLRQIADTIILRIRPSLAPTVLPEATAEISLESTTEIVPESTAEAETTAEATPAAESTAEVTPDIATDEVEVESAGTEVAAVSEATPLPERTAEPTPDVTATFVAQATGIAARTIKIARNLSVVAPEGWAFASNNHSYITLNYGDRVADAVLNQQPIPEGEALIVIEVGTAQEMFPPGSPGDLPGRLKHRVENLSKYVEPVTFGEIRQTRIHNKNAVEVLINSTADDQYVLLVDIGGSIFIQVKLFTAPGRVGDFSAVAFEAAASIVPR